ncbi:hypothetical protein K7432_009835 [Basidiobolus ranarum]|uniref:Uncharacterized protein n=1 Tax=Basidiobolus ranarum TaxID=34480 RepID=A0ABR2VWF3_9FUNG
MSLYGLQRYSSRNGKGPGFGTSIGVGILGRANASNFVGQKITRYAALIREGAFYLCFKNGRYLITQKPHWCTCKNERKYCACSQQTLSSSAQVPLKEQEVQARLCRKIEEDMDPVQLSMNRLFVEGDDRVFQEDEFLILQLDRSKLPRTHIIPQNIPLPDDGFSAYTSDDESDNTETSNEPTFMVLPLNNADTPSTEDVESQPINTISESLLQTNQETNQTQDPIGITLPDVSEAHFENEPKPAHVAVKLFTGTLHTEENTNPLSEEISQPTVVEEQDNNQSGFDSTHVAIKLFTGVPHTEENVEDSNRFIEKTIQPMVVEESDSNSNESNPTPVAIKLFTGIPHADKDEESSNQLCEKSLHSMVVEKKDDNQDEPEPNHVAIKLFTGVPHTEENVEDSNPFIENTIQPMVVEETDSNSNEVNSTHVAIKLFTGVPHIEENVEDSNPFVEKTLHSMIVEETDSNENKPEPAHMAIQLFTGTPRTEENLKNSNQLSEEILHSMMIEQISNQNPIDPVEDNSDSQSVKSPVEASFESTLAKDGETKEADLSVAFSLELGSDVLEGNRALEHMVLESTFSNEEINSLSDSGYLEASSKNHHLEASSKNHHLESSEDKSLPSIAEETKEEPLGGEKCSTPTTPPTTPFRSINSSTRTVESLQSVSQPTTPRSRHHSNNSQTSKNSVRSLTSSIYSKLKTSKSLDLLHTPVSEASSSSSKKKKGLMNSLKRPVRNLTRSATELFHLSPKQLSITHSPITTPVESPSTPIDAPVEQGNLTPTKKKKGILSSTKKFFRKHSTST